MRLDHKGSSPPPRPDWGQSPQSRGSGSHCQCLYNGHVNQRSQPARKIQHYSEALIPYGAAAVECTIASRLPPLRRRRRQFECDSQPYGIEHLSPVI
jgi:hypothetical protein